MRAAFPYSLPLFFSPFRQLVIFLTTLLLSVLHEILEKCSLFSFPFTSRTHISSSLPPFVPVQCQRILHFLSISLPFLFSFSRSQLHRMHLFALLLLSSIGQTTAFLFSDRRPFTVLSLAHFFFQDESWLIILEVSNPQTSAVSLLHTDNP